MLSSVLSAIELALSSPPLRFDPPGLASTTCDRITSSTTCHNETHRTPHGKDSDASKIGECVLDDSKKECSDGCCCVTSGDGDSENCHDYNLDNYTLDALVESGDEEYQHFRNDTGHWVRRHVVKVPCARSSPCGHILGQRRRPP